MKKVLITGGAGFIGSHLGDFLLKKGYHLTAIDNLSWGKKEFISHNLTNPRFKFIKADLLNYKDLLNVLDSQIDTVFHLAANSDIMRGAIDPSIDFKNTTQATFNILEVMRKKGIKKIFYTSGSGVYGDIGKKKIPENYGPLLPISMYGATKLSAEAMISSFVNLYDFQAWMIRPANIIGSRATHGVIYDFINRLKKDPSKLDILGNGKQNKSYLYITDVINAIDLIWMRDKSRISIYNVASDSTITVNQIARMVLKEMCLKQVKINHSMGDRGWKGDVPIISLTNSKLSSIGWKYQYSSKQAVRKTVQSLLIN
ncbi:hypothetical protein A3C23_01720 [Candidatus Roizmanbacteria bacterium RIFCSPHIGHO2_02_FULL_37_13b]|uniref:NAD-dependent epimerase/dehydratase domain-containing protein n=1 Tax=Candidatus Roizmanbacteria bacterium RIFCSPLOWO2_02_FULL_36_11 TaxID=1802071 RepID=A0A1F7JCX0_9BACT|nr:MAG: hypothetical protein A3C23_01720 [Candidatus Roizmanbacteria bacterium RIFCSPHIGHO2_02_FULL_37_13b]OGK53454.1 MAG: hypothetical protein A3H78_02880 [Candidatus Roizmanbacteria bacterium RIFCSPLOWO2_02_FULL_36_11]